MKSRFTVSQIVGALKQQESGCHSWSFDGKRLAMDKKTKKIMEMIFT